MKNKIMILMLVFLLIIPIVNAQTPIEEFFQEEYTDMTIKITQDETFVDFYINTNRSSFDEKIIWYSSEGIRYGIKIKLSELLNGNNYFTGIYGKVITEKNKNYSQFEGLTLGFGAKINEGINNKLKENGCDFTLNDINLNNEILNNFSKRHPLNDAFKWTTILEKEKATGNYYLYMDIGFGNIREYQKEKIREMIEKSFYYFDIKNIVNKYTPYDVNISEFFDLSDYSFEIIDINDFQLEDGEYEIVIQIKHEDTIANKTIKVILDGIINEEPVTEINYTFIPSSPEIKVIINEISGLPNNTKIAVKVSDKVEGLTSPLQTTALKFLNISVDKQTSAEIVFKVPTHKVKNKNKVFLYILEDNWKKLPTNFIQELGGNYQYKAQIPHFSTFVIAEEKESESTSSRGGSSSRRDDSDEEDYQEFEPQPKICNNWETKCVSNDVYQCFGNKWKKVKSCENGCKEGVCIQKIVEKEEPTFWEKAKDNWYVKVVFGLVITIIVFILFLLWEKYALKHKKEDTDYVTRDFEDESKNTT